MEMNDFVKKEIAKIESSDVFVSLVTPEYLGDNWQCALEIGIAILLNKPIRLLVKEGTKIPNSLERLAEKIEYFKSEEDIGIVGKRLLSDLK